MDEEKVQKFINTLYLRHQLCCQTSEEMVNGIVDDEHFLAFLDTAIDFAVFDCGFLFFNPEFSSKIENVMSSRRWTTKDKETFDKINEIIRLLNNIDNTEVPLKKNYRLEYKFFQEDLRETSFKTDNKMLESLAYDYPVFYALKYDMIELIDEEIYRLVLPSIMYLLKECPDLFQDEHFFNNTKKLIEMMRESKVFKRKDKKIIKTLSELINNSSKKEE